MLTQVAGAAALGSAQYMLLSVTGEFSSTFIILMIVSSLALSSLNKGWGLLHYAIRGELEDEKSGISDQTEKTGLLIQTPQ